MRPEPIDRPEKASILTRLRRRLRLRTRLKHLMLPLVGEAWAQALDAGTVCIVLNSWRLGQRVYHKAWQFVWHSWRLGQRVYHKAWQFVWHPWRLGQRACRKAQQVMARLWHLGQRLYRRTLQFPQLLSKLPQIYWSNLYRLCFLYVLLGGRSKMMLRGVWRHSYEQSPRFDRE
jgi:hypothetical protein